MKKFLPLLIALFLPLAAIAQEIRDVDITVRLQRNGTAYVTQRWDVNIVSGTEWYMPVTNLGQMTIDSLRVFEGEKEFASDGMEWDSDRSREEKAFRCGIVDKGPDGIELCWGQGEYGDHFWTASYIVRGLVHSLQDYDGFNFMFLNDNLIAGPQHARVTLVNETGSAPWSEENTGIWSFGYTGTILFEEGAIVAESTEPLGWSNSVIVMCRFDKGMFAPVTSRDMTFEQMKDKAFKGSDYEDSVINRILGILCSLACLSVPLFYIFRFLRKVLLKWSGRIWKRSVFGSGKVSGWWREPPLQGDLDAAYSLLEEGNRINAQYDARLIGAYFLLWIQQGLIKVRNPQPGGKQVNLEFDPSDDLILPDRTQVYLYNMALEASGSNHLLETKEFEKWAKSHYKKAIDWPMSARSKGHVIWKNASLEERRKLLQFKNFLEDFTLSEEREAIDVKLWGSYLVYAQLFGIADKVAGNFRKLYPETFQQYVAHTGLQDSVTLSSVINSTSTVANAMLRQAWSEKTRRSASSSRSGGGWSSSGGGGWSSSGGGGGFSGGGHGGGSR